MKIRGDPTTLIRNDRSSSDGSEIRIREEGKDLVRHSPQDVQDIWQEWLKELVTKSSK